jgi:hypothetical protein
LIDAGCLTLLWRLTRREGIRVLDLVGFERTRLVRDTLLGVRRKEERESCHEKDRGTEP